MQWKLNDVYNKISKPIAERTQEEIKGDTIELTDWHRTETTAKFIQVLSEQLRTASESWKHTLLPVTHLGLPDRA